MVGSKLGIPTAGARSTLSGSDPPNYDIRLRLEAWKTAVTPGEITQHVSLCSPASLRFMNVTLTHGYSPTRPLRGQLSAPEASFWEVFERTAGLSPSASL